MIALHAGEEHAVAATKTYTSQLLALALLSACVAEDHEMLDTLRQIPDRMREVLKMSEAIARAAERYRYMKVCVVIGRGFNYATAFETGAEDQRTDLRAGRALQQRRLSCTARWRWSKKPFPPSSSHRPA